MTTSEPTTYNFKKFLDDARNMVLMAKGALYIHLIFIRRGAWQQLEDIMDRYSSDGRRPWLVNTISSENDFYIVQFVNKENAEDQHFFFWKIWKEDANYLTIVSFSVEKFKYIQNCLKSLVHSAKSMWFSWIDSRILENFDQIAKSVFGDMTFNMERATIELRSIGKIEKRAVEVRWMLKDKKELENRRRSEYEQNHRIVYMKRLRFLLQKDGYAFKASVSDESEILLEQGDLFAFMNIINPLIENLSKIRDAMRKRISIEVTKLQVVERVYELKSIELLEVLTFQTLEPTTKNWFENVVRLFSIPFLEDEGLVNFPLSGGNPYFLVHIIDTENGSAVYLSATANEVRISPASEETSSASVSKIVRALQKYVDPTLIPLFAQDSGA